MVEAARRDGYAGWALDLFGDVDTRAAACAWRPIGSAASLAIDRFALLDGLAAAAADPRCLGWVAGSGFDASPDLLASGAALLPLLGTAPAAQRRVRDPRVFFETLARLRAPHPPVRHSAPADPRGWLVKDFGGCGGRHIREAADGPRDAAPQRYWQRRAAGRPMSALFVADRRGARRLAFNELIVRPEADAVYAYQGAVGPIPLPPQIACPLDALLDGLAAAFGLAGLASLDFLLGPDGRWQVLELNPRPSASAALYPRAGLLRVHVQACREAGLAAPPAAAFEPAGLMTISAPADLDAPDWRATAGCHDRPAPGTRVAAGAPLCSVSAGGRDRDDVLRRLARRRRDILETLALETPT